MKTYTLNTDLSTIRRTSKVRYTKKLNQDIYDTLRRYNNKIDRLRRKQADYILPQKMTKEDLMESSYTTKDLRRQLNNLAKFNERGAEATYTTSGGYSISKYEYNYLRREQRRVKRKIEKEIERYQTTAPTVFGKSQGFSFAQMGDSTYLNLKAKRQSLEKDISKMNKEELLKYREVLYKLGKNRNYLAEGFRDNYLEILTDLGYFTGYDNEKLKLLKDKLKSLDPEEFYKLYENEKAIKVIRDYYPLFTDFTYSRSDSYVSDIHNLYDELINNIDEIITPYQ